MLITQFLLTFFHRVCGDWNTAILRGSAPFQRSVVIPTDFFCSVSFTKPESQQFWLLANEATTFVVCGKTELNDPYYVDMIWEESFLISYLWEQYPLGSYNRTGSRPRINKVIYANMFVNSNLFRCRAVLQVGFQTVLYKSTLELSTANIDKRYEDFTEGFLSVHDYIELKVAMVTDLHILTAAGLEEMEKYWEMKIRDRRAPDGCHNFVAEHFARNNCSHLEPNQLALLTDGSSLNKFGSGGEVRRLVQQLINRCTRIIA